MRPGGGRRARAVATLATVLVLASGCGFLQDLAEPDDAPSIPVADPSAADETPAVEPPGTRPVVVVAGELLTEQGRKDGRLTVTVGPAQTGVVPPVPNFADSCPVAATSLQYVPVDFAYTTTGTGAMSPIGAGRTPRRQHRPRDAGGHRRRRHRRRVRRRLGAVLLRLPAAADQRPLLEPDGRGHRERLRRPGRGGHRGDPDGRADVFPTLRLRISDLRVFDDREHVRSLTLGELSVGAACPDDPEAICVSLG